MENAKEKGDWRLMMENNIIQKLIDEKKYFEIRKYLNDLNIVEV